MKLKPAYVDSSIRSVCEQKMRDTIALCQTKTTKPIPTPPMVFQRLGCRAGVCVINHLSNTTTILINPDFFKDYYDDMLNDTVPHEVAHHVACFLFGRQANGHGHYWKMVMRWIGLHAADRCHTYNVENARLRNVERPFKYSCNCKTHFLTNHLHTKHQS